MWRDRKHGKVDNFVFLPRDDDEDTAAQQDNPGVLHSTEIVPEVQQHRLVDEDTEDEVPLIDRKKRKNLPSSSRTKKKQKSIRTSAARVDSLDSLLATSPLSGREDAGATSLLESSGPRALEDMTGSECQAILEAQTASKDLNKYDSQDADEFANDLSYSIQAEKVRHLSAVRHIKRMSAALRAKEGDLLSALERCTSAEEGLRRANSANERLQVERDSLVSEMERMRKEKEEELANLKHSLSEGFRGRLNQLKEEVARKENEAFHHGIREYRMRYFLTIQGQQFLRILLQETLEGFCRTPEVLQVIGPGIHFLVDSACQILLNGIDATAEQRSLYNLDEVTNAIDATKLDELLGIDSNAPRTPGWWIPVLDKALSLFVDDICADPLPKRPVVRTPVLDRLRETTRSPKGNYPGGALFYPLPPKSVAEVSRVELPRGEIPAANDSAVLEQVNVGQVDKGQIDEEQVDEENVIEDP